MDISCKYSTSRSKKVSFVIQVKILKIKKLEPEVIIKGFRRAVTYISFSSK